MAAMAFTVLITIGGGMFAMGHYKGRIDGNRDDIKQLRLDTTASMKQQREETAAEMKQARESVTILAAAINGDLGKVHVQIATGNRELSALTEAVNTLKVRVEQCSAQIGQVNTNLADKIAGVQAEVAGLEARS